MGEGDKAGAETECVIGRVLRFGDQCRDAMQLPGLDKQAITGARCNREDGVVDGVRRKERDGEGDHRKKEKKKKKRTDQKINWRQYEGHGSISDTGLLLCAGRGDAAPTCPTDFFF